jgi:transmembrane sensor
VNNDTLPAIPPDVARQAVNWLLALSDQGRGHHANSERARTEWQAWLDASPVHRRAWQRIAEVDGQLRGVPTAVALQTLAAPGSTRRRAVHLALLLTAGAGTLLAARETGTWQQLTADLSTATGEQRDAVLPDGTQIRLNTATAVDLRYSGSERLIVLRAGEILLHSAPDPARPLRVQTAEGTARAIGTRFTVHQQTGQTAVAVLEGAVELNTRSGASQRLQAGEQARFTDAAIHAAQPLTEGTAAWSRGMLVADNLPLPEFLAELARHRPGVLRCAPDAADLRVSGSYPLADTDRVLAALTRSLPVQIHTHTRWWVVVKRSETAAAP